VLDRHALFHPEFLHQPGDSIGAENAHQIVFEREIEAGGTGIALAAGAPSELVVDAPGFVTLGAENVQTAQPDDLVVFLVGLALEVFENSLISRFRYPIERIEVVEVDVLLVLDETFFAFGKTLRNLLGQALLTGHELGVAAEQNVGSTTGHVGRNRHGTLAPGLGHELSFLGVILRVEDDVLVHAAAGRGPAFQSPTVEHRRQFFRFLDRDRADQHRTPLAMLIDNLRDNGIPLFCFRPVHEIRILDS
jgi:hypothetical protein